MHRHGYRRCRYGVGGGVVGRALGGHPCRGPVSTRRADVADEDHDQVPIGVTDDGDPRREKTRAFFQELGPPDPEDAGAILTGWVVVQEWMNPNGEKSLVRGWDHSLTRWSANGMMHEALYGDWSEVGDE
jgi:hypothetical protein